MGVNASTLCSSAPRRFLEDVWIARLATTEFATEEEVRLLLEEMLRFEGAAEPEMTALVLTVRFFSGGATLPIMLDSEFEVRQFLLGYQKDEEQEKQYAEEEKEEEEDDHDDDDDDELGFRGADGVLFLSSDVFLEAAPAPIPAPAAVDFPKELIIAASCLAAHCMSPLQLVALPVPVQMALLPSLLQEPQLAGKLDSSLVRLASHCAQSGMRVSPTWLPHLLSIEELKDTVRLFDACPVFVTSTNQVNPFDGSVLRQVVAVKQFVSGHAPTLIRCVSDGSQDQLMVLKRDNLTTDFACISCFRVFNFLWELSGLGVKTRVFGVVPLTPDLGLMEFVGDSEPLTSWNIKEAIIKFSSQTLNEFLDSAAGSFVACFVLGIRDRHRDNIMIQSGHLLWQLDFKHVFNRTTTGVDAPRFAVPRVMKDALIVRGAWSQFKLRCARALVALRRHSGLIVQLARSAFRHLAPDDQIQKCISSALFLGKTESDVSAALSSYIEVSVYSLKKYIKNTLHGANMMKMTNQHGGGIK